MTVIELSELSWKELRAEAKSQGIKTHGIKRPALQALLMDAGINSDPDEAVSWSVIDRVDETTEQQIERLKSEILTMKAEPDAPLPGGPFGRDYWNMSHTELKTLMQTAPGLDPSRDDGTQESMIGQLQAADFKQGLKPHPKGTPVSITGKESFVTALYDVRTNSLGCPVRDVIFLKDQSGNLVFTVHRIGNKVDGVPTLMDMDGHAQRVMDLFNSGGTQ